MLYRKLKMIYYEFNLHLFINLFIFYSTINSQWINSEICCIFGDIACVCVSSLIPQIQKQVHLDIPAANSSSWVNITPSTEQPVQSLHSSTRSIDRLEKYSEYISHLSFMHQFYYWLYLRLEVLRLIYCVTGGQFVQEYNQK